MGAGNKPGQKDYILYEVLVEADDDGEVSKEVRDALDGIEGVSILNCKHVHLKDGWAK